MFDRVVVPLESESISLPPIVSFLPAVRFTPPSFIEKIAVASSSTKKHIDHH